MKSIKEKLQNIFPFSRAYDTYNVDLEMLVLDEEEKKSLFSSYKDRFLKNRSDATRYQPIIPKHLVADESDIPLPRIDETEGGMEESSSQKSEISVQSYNAIMNRKKEFKVELRR